MFSLNRVVVVLTPLVFAPAAAFLTAWLARHFPGLPTPSTDQIVGLEALGFASAVAGAAHWLHGHQKERAALGLLLQYGRAGEAITGGFMTTAAAAPVVEPSLSLSADDQPPILAAPPEPPEGEPKLVEFTPADTPPAAVAVPQDPTLPSS